MHKFGQGSAEYLVILAVVLIVALVGVMLIGAFPSMGGDAQASEYAQYWSATRPFAVPEYTQVNDTFYITLKNSETKRLTLQGLQIGNVTYNVSSGGIVFAPSSSKTLSIAGFRQCNDTTYDSFEYNLTINYTTSGLTSVVSQRGSKPLSGRCVSG